jgi:hypothetical protein
MKYQLKSYTNITIDESAKEDFKQLMDWTETQFINKTVEIDKQEQSHRETPSVSGDSATQNSLEKGMEQYNKCEEKTLRRDTEKSILVALADQKQKIREWLISKNIDDDEFTKQDEEEYMLNPIFELKEFDSL